MSRLSIWETLLVPVVLLVAAWVPDTAAVAVEEEASWVAAGW